MGVLDMGNGPAVRKGFTWLLIGLLATLIVVPATAGSSSPPPPGEMEVPIIWDVDPSAAESNRVVTTGTAERPLTEWTALTVEATGTYTVCVQTVYGEGLLAVRGEGNRRYTLRGSDPLWLSYEGPVAKVRLYGWERKMTAVPAGGGLVRYETGQAIIPAGVTYRAEMVNLRPGSGVKAALVCASWGGAGWLHLTFRDAASGVELGHADLRPERPCSPVWGRVNRPFTVEVTAADDTVQLYDLILR